MKKLLIRRACGWRLGTINQTATVNQEGLNSTTRHWNLHFWRFCARGRRQLHRPNLAHHPHPYNIENYLQFLLIFNIVIRRTGKTNVILKGKQCFYSTFSSAENTDNSKVWKGLLSTIVWFSCFKKKIHNYDVDFSAKCACVYDPRMWTSAIRKAFLRVFTSFFHICQWFWTHRERCRSHMNNLVTFVCDNSDNGVALFG